MNLQSLSAAVMAALMMAACASDEPAVNNPSSDAQGFLAVSVSLPFLNGSASRSVTYSDGSSDEYAVESAALLIFKKSGASEMDYTFVESATLGGLAPWNTSGDEQITTSATGVARLSGNISVTNADEYYAMVVLNNPTTGGVNYPASGQTFGSWINAPQTPAMAKVFYMASAPRFVSGTIPTTLIKLDKSKIAASEATATEIGAQFFVERGVAKVTVSDASLAQKDVAGSTYAGDKVTINKWALDVVNKSTFPVHNVDGLATSYADIWSNTGTADPCTARFVGGNNTFMRVFWAKDPNYSSDITSIDAMKQSFNILSAADLENSNNAGKPLYCFENTFDINHQMQGQTTRVVFKAKYQPQGFAADETFFRIGAQSTLWNLSNLQNFIAEKARTLLDTNDAVAVKLSSAITANAGSHPLSADMVEVNGAPITSDKLQALVALLGAESGINTYLNGDCYYVARIKHFGDIQTPWSIGQPTYAGDNLKYLGRYGLVRNNWYDLNVGAVSNPGFSVIPEIDPVTPDDETDLYISVSINVLPWAKRVQEVEL